MKTNPLSLSLRAVLLTKHACAGTISRYDRRTVRNGIMSGGFYHKVTNKNPVTSPSAPFVISLFRVGFSLFRSSRILGCFNGILRFCYKQANKRNV